MSQARFDIAISPPAAPRAATVSSFSASSTCAPAKLTSIASGDRRQREYQLTAAGRKRLAGLRASRKRAIDAIWSDLPDRDLERFAGFSGELSDRLERYLESGSR